MMDQKEIDWGQLYDADMLDKFWSFHRDNPHIYRQLVDSVRLLKSRGHTHCGIALLWERMRWLHMVRTSDLPFKLNNNHRAFYTRLIDHREPDLAGFITRRTSQADEGVTE